jgi:hypothetical protein
MNSYLEKVSTMQDQFDFETKANEEKEDINDDPNERTMMQSRKAYYRELKKVIEESDVLI